MNHLIMIPMYSAGCAEILYDPTREIDVLPLADQLLMRFPFTIRAVDKWHTRILVDRIYGQVFQENRLIGTVSQDVRRDTLINSSQHFPIEATIAASSLMEGEEIRSSKEPALDFRLQFGLIEQFVKRELGQVREPESPIFHSATIQIQQKIPRDRWLKLLENAKLGNFFFLEAQFPNDSGGVLSVIARVAYKHFLEGGSAGYQACVAELRKGLELLKTTYGLKSDRFADKPLKNQSHTKQDRLELIFHSLHHYSHPSHHENEIYSQTEAQMALGMFLNLAQILCVPRATEPGVN